MCWWRNDDPEDDTNEFEIKELFIIGTVLMLCAVLVVIICI